MNLVVNNKITITVTTTNAIPQTKIYIIDVHREYFTSYNPSENIPDFTNLTSTNIYGLWSSRSTIWIAGRGTTGNQNSDDTYAGKIYSYNPQIQMISTNSIPTDKDNPRGI